MPQVVWPFLRLAALVVLEKHYKREFKENTEMQSRNTSVMYLKT